MVCSHLSCGEFYFTENTKIYRARDVSDHISKGIRRGTNFSLINLNCEAFRSALFYYLQDVMKGEWLKIHKFLRGFDQKKDDLLKRVDDLKSLQNERDELEILRLENQLLVLAQSVDRTFELITAGDLLQLGPDEQKRIKNIIYGHIKTIDFIEKGVSEFEKDLEMTEDTDKLMNMGKLLSKLDDQRRSFEERRIKITPRLNQTERFSRVTDQLKDLSTLFAQTYKAISDALIAGTGDTEAENVKSQINGHLGTIQSIENNLDELEKY